MSTVVITQVSGTGSTSGWKVMNTHVTPSNISIAVVTSGTANYSVVFTLDDVNLSVNPGSATNPNTFAVAASMTNATATQFTSINYPVSAIQMTYNSGTGSATLYVLQAGDRQS